MLDNEILATVPTYRPVTRVPELRQLSAGTLDYFDRTPPGILCPHFWKLSLGNACPIGCSYCFLARGGPLAAPVVFTDLARMAENVRSWSRMVREPALLNCGELSDSLLFDREGGHSRALFPLFEGPDNPVGHGILYVTKAVDVAHLVTLANELRERTGHEKLEHVVLSWSLNSRDAAAAYESGAPSPLERLRAAKTCQDAGYRVRLRLSPLIPTKGWQNSYDQLIRQIANEGLLPERFTLGALRLLPGMRMTLAKSGRSLDSLEWTGDRDRRMAIPRDLRAHSYSVVRKSIERRFPAAEIGICKETEYVRALVGIEGARCNCQP